MNPIIIRRSRTQATQFLLAGAGLALFGAIILELRSVHAGFMTFGGAAVALYGVWGVLDRRPRLFLDDRGISGKRLGGIEVPWDLLHAAYLRTIGRMKYVCLAWVPPGSVEPEQRPVRLNDLELGAELVLATILDAAKRQGRVVRGGA